MYGFLEAVKITGERGEREKERGGEGEGERRREGRERRREGERETKIEEKYIALVPIFTFTCTSIKER